MTNQQKTIKISVSRKEILRQSGIYTIRCLENGEQYIGSAQCLYKRFHVHSARLRSGQHHSKTLQKAYNESGPENLIFSPVLVCSIEQLPIIEESLIAFLNPVYNTATSYYGTQTGIKQSAETKAKISAANKGRKKGPASEQTKALLLFYNKQPKSENAKANLSAAKKGDKNPMFGLPALNNRSVCQYTLDGKFIAEFTSLKEAMLASGVDFRNIQAVCKGVRNSAGGFIWKYKPELPC